MRFGEKNEWNASLLAEAVPEFGGMLPSFVMQIEFLSSLQQVSQKDFFFFQGGGADLTCPYGFLQDSYLQQFPNELCQCSCWSDPLDIRACEAEWLMMHAFLAPVENITDWLQYQGLNAKLIIDGTLPPFGHKWRAHIRMERILQVRLFLIPRSCNHQIILNKFFLSSFSSSTHHYGIIYNLTAYTS